MSILIRDMNMPTDHSLWIVIHPDGTVETNDVSGSCPFGWQTLQNAAIPIPPHGRLGDLDKLVEKIDGIWDCNDMVFKSDDHCCNIPEDCKGCKWVQTKNCIQRMVENAPTVIEAEASKTVQCHECSHWQKWKYFSEYPERRWCDARGYYTDPYGSCPHGEVEK